MNNVILSTWGFYENAPFMFKMLMNIAALALMFFLIISALYTPVVKNNKVKRELMERDKEAMRLKIANEKASDKYLEYQKENEKLISNKIKLLEEISELEEQKKAAIEPVVDPDSQTKDDKSTDIEKNKGGRPKGSKNKSKK